MQIRKSWFLVLGVGTAAVLTGCAASRFSFRDPQQYKSASLLVTEIEDKGEVFHAQLRYENRTGKRVMILAKDVGCSRGDRKGTARLETEAEIIAIGAREIRALEITCRFSSSGSGDYKIRIEEVFEQPRAIDDSSLTRTVATDLEWNSAKSN